MAPRRLGRSMVGRAERNGSRAVEMTRHGKVQKPDFPTALGKPAQTAGFPHFHRPTTGFHLGQKKKNKKPLTPAAPFIDAPARTDNWQLSKDDGQLKTDD